MIPISLWLTPHSYYMSMAGACPSQEGRPWRPKLTEQPSSKLILDKDCMRMQNYCSILIDYKNVKKQKQDNEKLNPAIAKTDHIAGHSCVYSKFVLLV